MFQKGLKNKGKDCWKHCCGRQGRCLNYCGTGLCCRYGYKDISSGCDGLMGLETKGHVCWGNPNYKLRNAIHEHRGKNQMVDNFT